MAWKFFDLFVYAFRGIQVHRINLTYEQIPPSNYENIRMNKSMCNFHAPKLQQLTIKFNTINCKTRTKIDKIVLEIILYSIQMCEYFHTKQSDDTVLCLDDTERKREGRIGAGTRHLFANQIFNFPHSIRMKCTLQLRRSSENKKLLMFVFICLSIPILLSISFFFITKRCTHENDRTMGSSDIKTSTLYTLRIHIRTRKLLNQTRERKKLLEKIKMNEFLNGMNNQIKKIHRRTKKKRF